MSPDDNGGTAYHPGPLPPELAQPAPPNRHQKRALRAMARAQRKRTAREAREAEAAAVLAARRAAEPSVEETHVVHRDVKPDNVHYDDEKLIQVGAPKPVDPPLGAKRLQELSNFFDLTEGSGAADVLDAALTAAAPVQAAPAPPVTQQTLAEKIRAAAKR